jgi:hypothetical protein
MTDQNPAMGIAQELASIARGLGMRASAHVGMSTEMLPRRPPAPALPPEMVKDRLIRSPHALILLQRRRSGDLPEAARAEHIAAAQRTKHWLSTVRPFDELANDGLPGPGEVYRYVYDSERDRADDLLAVLLGRVTPDMNVTFNIADGSCWTARA